MTAEQEVSNMIKALIVHPYFKSIENRLDAGVQRKTLNVQAWEHILLGDSLMDFHIAKRNKEFPEIQYLDDNDTTNDNIATSKATVGSLAKTKKPSTK